MSGRFRSNANWFNVRHVSQRFDEIFRISNRVAMLCHGQLVGLRAVGHPTPDQRDSLIVGRQAREINRPSMQAGQRLGRL